MASPDPHPTSSCIRKLQHGWVGKQRAVTTGIGQMQGLQPWGRVSLRLTPSLGELTDLRNHVQGHPRLTNPITLPSISQQSRTPTTSACLCLEALIPVPHARPLSSNSRSCSSGQPRAAPNCPSLCGQHTIPHGSLSIHFPTRALCPKPNTVLTGEREQSLA